jgi:hypothetical protein
LAAKRGLAEGLPSLALCGGVFVVLSFYDAEIFIEAAHGMLMTLPFQNSVPKYFSQKPLNS